LYKGTNEQAHPGAGGLKMLAGRGRLIEAKMSQGQQQLFHGWGIGCACE
jgi:hypothetical protein